MLLHAFYSIRSECQTMEDTQDKLLFRWFIRLYTDDTVWVPTILMRNCERLIEHYAFIGLFNEVLAIPNGNESRLGEHFAVVGTLIQAWAGYKCFRAKGGGDDDKRGLKGQTRSYNTHSAATGLFGAWLNRMGSTAGELCFMFHTLGDNRHGLISNAAVTNNADGYAEREAAKIMIADAKHAAGESTRLTLGADTSYDEAEFNGVLLDIEVLPHVARKASNRKSAVPKDIAASGGYGISQQKQKLITQGFVWAKSFGPNRQVMERGVKKVDHMFVLTIAAYNLTRMRTLGQACLQAA